MHPTLFHIFGVKLYSYGLFVALGFMTAVWVSQKNAKPHGISPQTITDIFFVILMSALIGARLLYIVVNFESYQSNLLGIFKIWEGGLVFFGGFLAAVIVTPVYVGMKHLAVWKLADIISPGIALGHALGRIGCFFAGCCYGKACSLPFAIKFTNPESLAPIGIYLHPTQIYAVISNLVLFFILMALQKRKKFDGMVFLCYIMLYSLFRSIIEFFRGDFRGVFFFDWISLSQGIGLIVSLIAFILLIKLSRPFYGPSK
ncbi:prolipoprotein diacylglyceryl transferase [Desulfobacula sp.]|uniref:prolipoprotein diacylglyceryl transferase n=1 Tax=Desulfobacula sp. TaxID=2593537 RepID=UPI00260CAC65|nr:prolipoprotein diacylglyceryl transferase [Desulfobacula sp.]